MIFVSSAKNMGWKNFSMELEREFAWMYQTGYPIKMKAMILFKSHAIVRAIIKICKVFLTKKIQKRILVVNKSDELLGIVPAASLPDNTAIGKVTQEQIETMFIERMKRFKQQETQFIIPVKYL
mmetsp:Transcript_15274/g.23938  ORF Transcript_15274/g.23938 Transcript_15274/m.23938 type:complete len:124 (+) Transcript_15274:146-517(+)